VLRRLVKVSAAVVGAALLAAGCSPVKMGSAAIVGDQRITIATLDTEVTNLSQAARKYPGVVRLNQSQMTSEALTWLVRFRIIEELARQSGITVTNGQAQGALAAIYASAKQDAQASGVSNVTLEEILAANGIPPNRSAELGRYEAIFLQFTRNANGGTEPTPNSPQANAVNARFQHSQCLAAKSLKIQVNPQFGQMNYAQFLVVPAQPTVTRSEGPVKTASSSGLTPAC
jgi:SurA-like N-terminal domain